MPRVLAAALLFFVGAVLVAGDHPTAAPLPKAVAQVPCPLLGVWASEGAILVFEEKSLRILFDGTDPRSATLVADYSVTKDGVVYGIITREKLSAELDFPKGSLVDETFRFRVHVDGAELTVKDLRLPVPRVAIDPRVVKGWKQAEAGFDPLLSGAIGLFRLEGAMSGTYDRTTLDAAGKGRLSVPSTFVYKPAPGQTPPATVAPATLPPGPAPAKR